MCLLSLRVSAPTPTERTSAHLQSGASQCAQSHDGARTGSVRILEMLHLRGSAAGGRRRGGGAGSGTPSEAEQLSRGV